MTAQEEHSAGNDAADVRRYAVIGTGHRAQMYVDALGSTHADVGRLVAWCDSNPGRIDYHEEQFTAKGNEAPRRYGPADVERMIADEGVQTVVITTPDYLHAEMVDRAMRSGADVVLEKPMTTTVEGCQRIEAAIAETGRSIILTFNYRYSPRNTALKNVIASGEIGDVTSIHFEWVLDTMHGADYFRRWHREKAKSGGLLVHKSSHHFDLVNWWLADVPARVFASGALRFYGADNAAARGVAPRAEAREDRDTQDPFNLDLTKNPRLKRLYMDNEHLDGYIRDGDVFGEGITIEDNIAVLVDYSRGATLSYSLNAHGPWEGYRVMVNGTKGRAELEVVERGAVLTQEDGSLVVDPSAVASRAGNELRVPGERLVVQKHWEVAEEAEIVRGEGSHGGGDMLLLNDVFRGAADDPLARPAKFVDGVRSTAVGLAANLSLETGLPVRTAELGIGL